MKGRITFREDRLYAHARCDTCAFEGLPEGMPDPDRAARTHLRQNPDHAVSLSYAVERAYFLESS